MVAQELNTYKTDDLFAATPPLEAKKMLFSMATTEGVGYRQGEKEKGYKLDFVDVRRAYFHAKARRDVYVALPEEDRVPGMCGKLEKAMYGARDAAQNWEHEYLDYLEQVGFTSGLATPCIFHHKERDLRVVVHGDDFTNLGAEVQLDWLRNQLS